MRISEIVGASDAELDALVASLEAEIGQAWIDARPSGSSKPSHVPSVYPSGKRIAELAPTCRIRLVARLLDREVRRPSWHYDGTSENERSVLRWLLRAPLPWSAGEVIDLMRLWLKRSDGHSHEAIGRALLRIATPFAESREVWAAVAAFRSDYCVRYLNLLALEEERNEDEVRREVDAAFEGGRWPFAVDDIGLSSSDRELILSFDAFFSGVTEAEIRADDPLVHRMAQVDAGVTEHLIKAGGVKPSAKWRKELVLGKTGKLLETVLPTIRETAEPVVGVPADVLRGLAWALEADGDAKGLGRLAEASVRQIEGVGIVAQKAYFSAVQALGRLEGDDAVLALIELGRVAKRPKVRAAVEDAIATIAERRSVTIPELLEGATPDFGLDASGGRNDLVTGGMVRTEIVGSDVRTTFTTDAGQVRKSLPKEESTPAIKERAKEIARILQATKDSYDIRMASRSATSFGEWRNRVLLHPLLGTLARRLVWSVGGVAALWDGASLADVTGRPIEAEEKAEVLLWHPVESKGEEIRRWQKRVSDLGTTQPFRQIYREVYVPVREDGNAVGRFRAHVIRQGRAATVMQGRGWRWPAIGTFDSGVLPSRELPGGWKMELDCEPAEMDAVDVGLATWIRLGEVRFSLLGSPVNSAEIPPRIFSEGLRDVDLAIAVGGGAYDPDREERKMPSPGELEGTWRLRADALTHLLPRLGLPAKIEGRHLESGDYRIHLGTGHVFDAAGTMVPFETGPMPDIVLPFEGDPTLARIVALVMHLVAQ